MGIFVADTFRKVNINSGFFATESIENANKYKALVDSDTDFEKVLEGHTKSYAMKIEENGVRRIYPVYDLEGIRNYYRQMAQAQ